MNQASSRPTPKARRREGGAGIGDNLAQGLRQSQNGVEFPSVHRVHMSRKFIFEKIRRLRPSK